MNPPPPTTYWDQLAARFQHQQPPLRPCPEDVRNYERIIRDWSRQLPPARINVLLMGVTPEIATLAWPARTQLLAVEKSRVMIDVVWPGDVEGHRRAVHDNWFTLPVVERSIDLIVGDGVLTAMRYPDHYLEMARLMERRLRPGGRVILRVFARQPNRDSLSEIVRDLQAGRIPRFDILKWRLAMALQPDVQTGVALQDIHAAWHELKVSHAKDIQNAAWPLPAMETIELYQGRDQRYTFPTLEELDEVFSKVLQRFEVVLPGYELGGCCPTVVYGPRN